MLAVGIFLWQFFIKLMKFPFIPSLLMFFLIFKIINEFWILSNVFSASVDMISWSLFFSLLMQWVTLIDFKCWTSLAYLR